MENLKILPVRKSAEFKSINNKGSKFISKLVILLTHKTPSRYNFDQKQGKNAENFCRVGYTVSKTVGGAVVRNKAKRRLREAFRDLSGKYAKPSHDYIVIARKEIAEADFQEIIKNLEFCIKRIHTPRTNKKPSDGK